MKRKIGRTGVEVFPIGLGAMPLSIQGRPSEKDAIKVIHAALDGGVQFIDTANVYCLDQTEIGHNERLITKALESYRKAGTKIYIGTKGGLARPQGDWVTDGAPAKLRIACEESLKALKTESIFLYQLHSPDDEVPFEQSIEELAKLKKEGKIQHLGLSNVSQEQLAQALEITRIESVQNRCNVYHRLDIQNGMIEFCRKNEITYIAYSPVGGGHGHLAVAEDPLLNQLAHRYHTTPYCIALSWLLSQNEAILPIPGASRVKSIQDSITSPSLKLSQTDLAAVSQLRS